MYVIDPGHRYKLVTYDGDIHQVIQFMKRCGEGYPGNTDKYPGTNCQEVIRVLIDRVKYLNEQVYSTHNETILDGLRQALTAFELRVLERHGNIEEMIPCTHCGHIACDHPER